MSAPARTSRAVRRPASPKRRAAPEDVSRRFRSCVGLYPTGVAVVTCAGDGQPAGMTINSFVSVSLDPLLVLVSLHTRSRTLAALAADPRLAICLLHQRQLDTALAFSEPQAPFPAEHVRPSRDGFLLVPDALATLRCETTQLTEAGDHTLVLARVRSFEAKDGDPLLFYRGEFGTLTPLDGLAELAALVEETHADAGGAG